MAFMVLGVRIFTFLGVAEAQLPPSLVKLQENRLVCGAIFFGLNMLSSSLSQSGAFEISLITGAGRRELWSAIANGGRVPSAEQIAEMVGAALEPFAAGGSIGGASGAM